MKEYRKRMDQIEELESIRAYDQAKSFGDDKVLFEKAVKEIEKDRR